MPYTMTTISIIVDTIDARAPSSRITSPVAKAGAPIRAVVMTIRSAARTRRAPAVNATAAFPPPGLQREGR